MENNENELKSEQVPVVEVSMPVEKQEIVQTAPVVEAPVVVRRMPLHNRTVVRPVVPAAAGGPA